MIHIPIPRRKPIINGKRICRTCGLEKEASEFYTQLIGRRKLDCSECYDKVYVPKKKPPRGNARDDWMKCERRPQTHNRAYEELDNGIY